MANEPDVEEARRLLAKLNEWQRMSGMPPEGKAGFKSLGESNAAIDSLKRKLDESGVPYRWSEKAQKWELILGEPNPDKR